MKIGDKNFNDLSKTYVFGILNATPDSFSDGGKYTNIDLALKHTKRMIEEGADIIDVGGESTRPGYEPVSIEQEIERVCPIIEKIKAEFDVPISLDTQKSAVAKAGIQAGASLINDIWGLKKDKSMAKIIAKSKVSCCLVHNKSNAPYQNLIFDVVMDLKESVEIALEKGIDKDRICIDPGIGFGKTVAQNLELINSLELLKILKFPILLGASKKSFIGAALNLPVGERLEGTLATTALAVFKGASFVRVHDVKENVRIIRMLEAIKKYKLYEGK